MHIIPFVLFGLEMNFFVYITDDTRTIIVVNINTIEYVILHSISSDADPNPLYPNVLIVYIDTNE